MRQIKFLSGIADKFQDEEPTIEYGAHTLLKLIFISSYANNFSIIAKGPRALAAAYDAAIYVDLFAGPGIIKIKETGDRVVGSPIAATYNKKFDFSIFVERGLKAAQALHSRVGSYLEPDKFKVIRGDCNEEVGNVVKEVESRFKKPIILVLVDPEGMEAKFETMKMVSSKFPSIDFVINMTAYAERVRSTIQKGHEENKPIFSDYLGAEQAEKLLAFGNDEGIGQIYVEQVKNVLGKQIGETLPVRDKGDRVVYYLLAYTRQRGSESWGRILLHIKKQLEGVDGVQLKDALDVLKKRRGTLDSLWEDVKKD